jgi:protein-S-isoprenylcysteine O-methyltransferase Ste14
MKSLATRMAAQSAGFFLLFALIFIAAGTIYFWQGWLFCLSFWCSTAGIGVYLLKHDPDLLARRMRFGPRAETRPIQKIIVTLTLMMFAGVIILSALDHRFGWSQVPAVIVVIANVIVIATFGFFLLVLRENHFAGSTISVEAGQRVISSGPYGRVRHPMYAGALLLVLAIPIALGSWWGLLVPVTALPLLVVRIIDEEHVLSAELSGYNDYRRTVPFRLIPHVW